MININLFQLHNRCLYTFDYTKLPFTFICLYFLMVFTIYYACHATFLVPKLICFVSFLKSLEPPSFLVKPESQQAVPDSTVEFKAVLKGTPPFKIKWFKEDLELVSGPNCLFGIEGSTGFLNLYSVDISKSGCYSCQVSNDVGSDSCTTTLSVTGVLIHLLYVLF